MKGYCNPSSYGEMLFIFITEKANNRDVAKVFNWRESSNDRRVFGPKAHSSMPLARYSWGGLGACPPVNFENVHSQRCIFLDFGDKIKGIQGRLLSGNDEKKIMMNWSVGCCYC